MNIKKFTKIIDGKNVNTYCDETLSVQAESILEMIGNTQKSKNILQDGYKIQIGWSMYFINLIDGELAITIPDYKKNPFKDTESDISLAVLVQMQQNDMLRQTNMEGEYVTFQDTMIILKDALDSSDLFFVREETEKAKDSGWYLGLLSDAENRESRPVSDYISVHTYQLLTIKPELLKLLFLPTGSMAIIKYDEITEILDADNNLILSS